MVGRPGRKHDFFAGEEVSRVGKRLRRVANYEENCHDDRGPAVGGEISCSARLFFLMKPRWYRNTCTLASFCGWRDDISVGWNVPE